MSYTKIKGGQLEIYDETGSFNNQQQFNIATITFAETASWDMNTAQVASLTLTGSGTLIENPTNIVAGGTYLLYVIQDATGGWSVTWDTAFKWPSGTAPTLSTGANAYDVIAFSSYDGASLDGVIQQNFS